MSATLHAVLAVHIGIEALPVFSYAYVTPSIDPINMSESPSLSRSAKAGVGNWPRVAVFHAVFAAQVTPAFCRTSRELFGTRTEESSLSDVLKASVVAPGREFFI